eukprot:1154873-Pelagomonas_calceolata.AAC.7
MAHNFELGGEGHRGVCELAWTGSDSARSLPLRTCVYACLFKTRLALCNCFEKMITSVSPMCAGECQMPREACPLHSSMDAWHTTSANSLTLCGATEVWLKFRQTARVQHLCMGLKFWVELHLMDAHSYTHS